MQTSLDLIRKKEGVAQISENATLKESISIINQVTKRGGEPGIGIILNNDQKVLGVVTDGDIRRAICDGIELTSQAKNYMSSEFTFLYSDLTFPEQLRFAQKQIQKVKHLNDPRVTQVVVCDRDKRFIGILNLLELYRYGDITNRKIAVYGMGYVGLTLALTIAELQLFEITGYDVNQDRVRKLNEGISPFFENGLDSTLEYCLKNKSIQFKTIGEDISADIHILCVGTPIGDDGKPNLNDLISASNFIGGKLKEGDLVICRSTVPVGTTRNILIPLLEKTSNLQLNKNFFVAFAPERTIAGNALKELKNIPQVIGASSTHAYELASQFFQKFNSVTVQVNSLEASEIVKLINNTYRDTVFSFSNEVALLCSEYNLNAFEVIGAATDGYPRNPIPLPSPGVGGSCLTKDPILYSFPITNSKIDMEYGKVSREVNRKVINYISDSFGKFLNNNSLKSSEIKVFLIGLAFKGVPDTSDVRHSSALELSKILKEMGIKKLYGFDAVLSKTAIQELELEPIELEKGCEIAQAIFFMNNHPANTDFNIYRTLQNSKKPQYLFDGWSKLNSKEIESIPGTCYSTMGYITNRSK